MSKLKRREFIAGGATAAIGLTCLSKGIRTALAAAQRTGKPLLTEKNLNAFIKANSLRTRKGQGVSAEAIRDLNGFIRNNFHLTEAQGRELASLSAEDKSKLRDAIKDIREKKGSISVRIVPADGSLFLTHVFDGVPQFAFVFRRQGCKFAALCFSQVEIEG